MPWQSGGSPGCVLSAQPGLGSGLGGCGSEPWSPAPGWGLCWVSETRTKEEPCSAEVSGLKEKRDD